MLMNTGKFTGKAQAYAAARPGYPDQAIAYIRSLVPQNAVFADIGAGTGKFTELIARHGYEIYAVEPNDDMREQLAVTLAPFDNVRIVNGTAEATTLPNDGVDVVVCAQALGWFDLDSFRAECIRIGKPGVTVIALYNDTPGDNHTPAGHRLSSKQAAQVFFKNPTVRTFPNPILYSRERWIQKQASISDNPRRSEPGYDEYITKVNEMFDRYNINGFLRENLTTIVYHEGAY